MKNNSAVGLKARFRPETQSVGVPNGALLDSGNHL
jgi:hypothetical protein